MVLTVWQLCCFLWCGVASEGPLRERQRHRPIFGKDRHLHHAKTAAPSPAAVFKNKRQDGNKDPVTMSSYITKSLCNQALPDTQTLEGQQSLAGGEKPLTTIVHEPNHQPKNELFTPAIVTYTRRRYPHPASAPRTGRQSRPFSSSRSDHSTRSPKECADHLDADSARRNSARRSPARCKKSTRSLSPSVPTRRVSSADPSRDKSEPGQSQQTAMLDGSLCRRSVQREVSSAMGKWFCDSSLNSNEVPDIHVKTACELQLEKLISHSAGLIVFLTDEGELSKGIQRSCKANSCNQIKGIRRGRRTWCRSCPFSTTSDISK